MKIFKVKYVLLGFFLVWGSCLYGEEALTKPKTIKPELKTVVPNFRDVDLVLDAKSYVLIDASTGKILKEHEGKMQIYPASLTKVLTLYLVADALHNEQITLRELVPISANAWKTGGSKMFVKVGTSVSVEDLIRGAATVSGNDATVALAEYLGGSEEGFVNQMNHFASLLGMHDSHFANASGLPRPDHYSTALDLALLSKRWLEDFPEYYHWFKEKWLVYNEIKQPNRNRLLWQCDWIDGLKTGHTEGGGYCLIASGEKENLRLIGVIIGASQEAARNQGMLALLNFGFRNYRRQLVVEQGKAFGQLRIYKGKLNYVSVGAKKDFWVTVPRKKGEYRTVFQSLPSLKAPIVKGEICGTAVIYFNDEMVGEEKVVALETIPSGNFLKRTLDSFRIK